METKTIRQAVFDDEGIERLTDSLFDLPERILKAKEAIVEHETALKYDTKVADAKQAITDMEVEVAFEVLNDLDNSGKKKFTNEEKRKAETRRRLIGDEGYIRLCNVLKDAYRAEAAIRQDLGMACARFTAIEYEFKAKLAIAGMIAGLAHESTTQERIHRHVTAFETTVKLGENGYV